VILLIAACFLLGLMFGSFANVCVYRIPRSESIVFPASHCPACHQEIRAFDNIPVISWLMLAGKCRYCSKDISWRYPLLELLMGFSWGALAWHYGVSPILLQALCLFFLLWVLTFIDIETGLLPDVLTYPGIALGLAFSLWLGDWQASTIGAAAGYALFWLVARAYFRLTGREGMGYGDFKLLAMLGAFMGWQALPFIVFASSVPGALLGSVFLLLSRRGLRAEIPYGPYLALAGMVWFVWSEAVLSWYSGLMGIS